MTGASSKADPAAIDIRPATRETDFQEAIRLLEVMAIWDAAMSAPLGFSEAEIRETFYTDTAESLSSTYGNPKAEMLLAWQGGKGVGLVAYAVAADIGELRHFFVAPEMRGQGLGRRLLTQAVDEMTGLEARRIRLMTAGFMHSAHHLYREAGFRICPPYVDLGERYTPVTIFMERP